MAFIYLQPKTRYNGTSLSNNTNAHKTSTSYMNNKPNQHKVCIFFNAIFNVKFKNLFKSIFHILGKGTKLGSVRKYFYSKKLTFPWLIII